MLQFWERRRSFGLTKEGALRTEFFTFRVFLLVLKGCLAHTVLTGLCSSFPWLCLSEQVGVTEKLCLHWNSKELCNMPLNYLTAINYTNAILEFANKQNWVLESRRWEQSGRSWQGGEWKGSARKSTGWRGMSFHPHTGEEPLIKTKPSTSKDIYYFSISLPCQVENPGEPRIVPTTSDS